MIRVHLPDPRRCGRTVAIDTDDEVLLSMASRFRAMADPYAPEYGDAMLEGAAAVLRSELADVIGIASLQPPLHVTAALEAALRRWSASVAMADESARLIASMDWPDEAVGP